MTSWLYTNNPELLNSDFMRALLLMKLPQDLKRLVLTHPGKKLNNLAVLADTLWISGG